MEISHFKGKYIFTYLGTYLSFKALNFKNVPTNHKLKWYLLPIHHKQIFLHLANEYLAFYNRKAMVHFLFCYFFCLLRTPLTQLLLTNYLQSKGFKCGVFGNSPSLLNRIYLDSVFCSRAQSLNVEDRGVGTYVDYHIIASWVENL